MRIALLALALVGCQYRVEVVSAVYPPPGYVPGTVLPPYQGGYRVPVKGRWRVHRTHYGLQNDQAFAVDIVVDADHPAQTAGHELSEYPSYDQPIVADGPGVIAIAVDGIPENRVPTMNGYEAHGNFVVIDHKNGEFSLFAHLIPGSVKVKAGQVVQMGDELGRCGNSGNTTMPHLHYQIMDNFMPNLARGLPIRHLPYLKNGTLVQERLEAGNVFEGP